MLGLKKTPGIGIRIGIRDFEPGIGIGIRDFRLELESEWNQSGIGVESGDFC